MSSADDRRVALVTGATRGTGRAVAQELHRRGYIVVALHRGVSGEDWLTEINCDLTDPAAPARAAEQVLARFGRLDACVCNAAVRRLRPIAELDPADWDETVTVNLNSVFRLIRATLPAIRAAAGSYVLIGSHAGTHFFEGGAAYSATKAALRGLVETLLLEERHHGVRATLVNAGAIANRAGDVTPYKMTVESVARCVAAILVDQPADLAVGEIEIRPARLRPPTVAGLGRLQDV